ncbi:hypothetical protein RJ641_034300 [Dillenia turbinata]|uniref:Uncharacterized protein n=1 Tax=Dillenia turbinata TaxID=194707 RepID=A0AAN8VHH2_9MAGN
MTKTTRFRNQRVETKCEQPAPSSPILYSEKPTKMLHAFSLMPPSHPLNPKPFSKSSFLTNPTNPLSSSSAISSSFSLPMTLTPPLPLSIKTPEVHILCLAGRSDKKPGKPSSGRIEGPAEIRRRARRNARIRSKKLAESLFYRLKNPNKNYPDNFTEDELQMIGLGYDRMVRFMKKDDPNLRHPYDWYKYGQFGPYSWRGIVLGDPIRGRFSDERVSIFGEVKDHEEWEKIEQHEMAVDYQSRLDKLNRSIGFRYFWVFVRHPRWRVSELPWEQWTLVSEVVVEAKKEERLDKWTLMGRFGNKTRALITQCAAWFRPDIIYVKRPVYQCRFEPQDDFFRSLTPLLNPETEKDFMFEVKLDNERVELCTYFGGLCKIVKVNPKAYVDDVVKAYEKLTDEKKSECVGFLLSNHPKLLLHPYTKEWKAKLEEMELGCDAPDDDDDRKATETTEVVDWIEDDGDDDDEDDDGGADKDGEDDDVVLDVEDGQVAGGGGGDDDDGVVDTAEDHLDEEEDLKYWDEQFKKALSSSEAMERIAKQSVETSTRFYEKQIKEMEEKVEDQKAEDGDELFLRSNRQKVKKEEWKFVGYGPYRRRVKKSRIPPALFFRAAVRPFTYKDLVKEIVLTRHGILDGEIK